jgi:perosamine synthetase
MVELGYNYRLPDVQCALGMAQLERLPQWIARRQAVAGWYEAALAGQNRVTPLHLHADRTNAYHLYVVRLAEGLDRAKAFAHLRAQGIGANVHYAPVYLHSFYRARGYAPGLCPVAEGVYRGLLTLPMFPQMSQGDVQRVVDALATI